MGTYWDAALDTMEAEITGDAPFAPGDRVLLCRDPLHSWIVDHCEPGSRGFTVHLGIGNIVEIGPANDVMLAPEGWEDAPAMPRGSVQSGLSEADRQAKIAQDEASPLYHADMRCWHRTMIAWLTRWREIVGEEQTELGLAFHRERLNDMTGESRAIAAE